MSCIRKSSVLYNTPHSRTDKPGAGPDRDELPRSRSLGNRQNPVLRLWARCVKGYSNHARGRRCLTQTFMIQGTRTCRTRAAGLQEIPSCLGTSASIPGGWSWGLRHNLEIHTHDQRSSEKNKLHIFYPLHHLTDTIERRH
jgi:hypothetical protein